MSESSRSPRVLAAVVITLVVLVAHGRVVLGGMTWDDVRYHTEIVPPRLAASEAILAGERPTWWEGTGLGVPLLGEPSHGAAYPVTWLAATPLLFDLLVVLHLIWLALGVAAWARRLGADPLGSVLAGALIAASGIALGAATRGALFGLAHVPWIAWAALGLARAESPRAARRCAAIVGLLLGLVGLSGQLALLVDATLLAAVTGACRRTARWLVLAVAGGLAISAAQWIPTLAVASTMTGASLAGGLKLSRIVEVVLPGAFGATQASYAVPAIAGAAAVFPSVFVGAASFALAAVARKGRRVLALAGVYLVLTLVTGRGGSWPAWLGAPELHLAMLAVVVIAHAGAGVRGVIDGERRAVLSLAVAAGVTVLAVIAAGVLRARTDVAALDRSLVNGAIAAVCLIGAVAVAWRVRATWAPGLIAVLLVAPSVGSLGTTAPLTSRAAVTATPLWITAARSTRDPLNPRAPLRVFRPAKLYQAARDVTVADAVATLAGTSAARHGIGAARSDDPARPPLHDRVWFAASGAGGALLERFSITLAILPGAVVGERDLAELSRRGEQVLVKYPATPPAAMVFEWFWLADDAQAITRLFPPGAGRGLPAGLAILHGEGPSQQDEPRAPEPCTVTRWARGAIDLTCASQQPSYALVASTPAPGWTVEVDGKDTPWVTADVLQRAVHLDGGAHIVSWRYVAPGSALGFALALTALIGLVVLGASTLRRQRVERRP